MTDIDFRIILDQYIFDAAAIHDFYHCRYGKLPKPLREEVQKYFQLKSELKGVAGSELYYQLSKAKLNSVYGMSGAICLPKYGKISCAIWQLTVSAHSLKMYFMKICSSPQFYFLER